MAFRPLFYLFLSGRLRQVSLYIDTISMGLTILYFKGGSQVEVPESGSTISP